ncbi:class 1 fructose-bisphosphatase [Candidatus Kinetoplastidibacterium galati]|uniref:Fructose-1,6-bisphosphatase class 1 n=1 Tax=Candidatus Kinetoplastidibacterium galati TCC219 TaxID=1208921 RepID=M1M1B5_9PROT|nr:class 1 fructose-bisphosphatase [Candidatus Kinetoplastibacterium galatii]AGF49069.1 fructose-1,6-bisphosphatase I [Candidatus Kinetoplastibacterium galatii TCC219]
MNNNLLLEFLSEKYISLINNHQLFNLIKNIAISCKKISSILDKGNLNDIFGKNNKINVQGETQTKLDIIANDIIIHENNCIGSLSGLASEEMEAFYKIPDNYKTGDYLLLFDPLDGSSNIDVNISVGTIFSILKINRKINNKEIIINDFLQPGIKQIAAGYAIYGPQTNFVISLGKGVHNFTLNKETSEWILTNEFMKIPKYTNEFSINSSNSRYWDKCIYNYVQDCLKGSDGPLSKNYNMRWTGSMVADVHRIMTRGGIFLYPWDSRNPSIPGKLRLMYEANPMGFLVEQSGGIASNGSKRILEIVPKELHQRTSVILGSSDEVSKLLISYINTY